MAHRKLLALVGALVLLLAACGPEQRTSGKAARQESGAASASPSPAAESVDEDAQTTVRIYQLRLKSGSEKGGDSVRILVNNSTPDLRITLAGAIDQETNAVTVCSVPDPTSLPPSTQCVLPVADRPVDLPPGPGVRGVDISLAGRASVVDLQEIALTYTASDRRVQVFLPNLDPAPKDASCAPRGCPSFEMDPSRNGKVEAKASWNEPGSGLLDIRSAVPAPTTGTAATPPAYRVVTSSTSSSTAGPGSVSIAGTIRSGDTSVLAFTNNGAGPLAVPVLEATWP